MQSKAQPSCRRSTPDRAKKDEEERRPGPPPEEEEEEKKRRKREERRRREGGRERKPEFSHLYTRISTHYCAKNRKPDIKIIFPEHVLKPKDKTKS